MNRAALAILVTGLAISGCAATQGTAAPTPGPASPSASQVVERLEVAGSDLEYTAARPEGWDSFTFGLERGSSHPPIGIAFLASVMDNTFSDPCAQVERNPKVGPTVDDLVAALSEIPDTTATQPVDTMLAGYTATYLEVHLPPSLPCGRYQFFLWQESPSPGGDWWAQGENDTMRIWVLEVAGERVALVAHTYPETPDGASAEFEDILDSIVFDAP